MCKQSLIKVHIKYPLVNVPIFRSFIVHNYIVFILWQEIALCRTVNELLDIQHHGIMPCLTRRWGHCIKYQDPLDIYISCMYIVSIGMLRSVTYMMNWCNVNMHTWHAAYMAPWQPGCAMKNSADPNSLIWLLWLTGKGSNPRLDVLCC